MMNRRHRHFNPATAGATLALDARTLTYADAASVTSWSRPIAATSASEATNPPTMRPTEGPSGLPAVQFDGSNDVLAFSSALSTIRSVIMLIKDAGTANTYKTSIGNAAAFDWLSGPRADSSAAFLESKDSFSAANIRNGSAWKNGVSTNPIDLNQETSFRILAFVTAGNVNGDCLARDRGGVGFYPMHLAAIVIATSAWSDALRRRIEQSLAFSFRIACA